MQFKMSGAINEEQLKLSNIWRRKKNKTVRTGFRNLGGAWRNLLFINFTNTEGVKNTEGVSLAIRGAKKSAQWRLLARSRRLMLSQQTSMLRLSKKVRLLKWSEVFRRCKDVAKSCIEKKKTRKQGSNINLEIVNVPCIQMNFHSVEFWFTLIFKSYIFSNVAVTLHI